MVLSQSNGIKAGNSGESTQMIQVDMHAILPVLSRKLISTFLLATVLDTHLPDGNLHVIPN
jgi:hypothetical protein